MKRDDTEHTRQQFFRISMRLMIIAIIAICCFFGWIAHVKRDAEIQRDAVAMIRKVGGVVIYDWQDDSMPSSPGPAGGPPPSLNRVPGWPNWLVERMGIDAFGSVSSVTIRRSRLGVSQEMSDETLSQIAKLRKLKKLTVPQHTVGDVGLSKLRTLGDLEVLMLRNGTGITNIGLDHISKMKKLRELYIENTGIDDDGLAFLADLKRISTLNLSGNHIGDVGLARIDDLVNLEVLSLDGTQVSGRGIVDFLNKHTEIKKIYLGDTKVGDNGVASLALLGNLDTLSLRGTPTTDEGVKYLKSCKLLMFLDLSNTNIQDHGLKSLSVLRKLENLDLTNTKITDEGILNLKDQANLKELRLGGTNVTASGVAILQKMLPSTTISR